MLIDNWNCVELYPGQPWAMRQAWRGSVTVCVDSDGLSVREGSLGYEGGQGSYDIPANVLMWLVQAVRE